MLKRLLLMGLLVLPGQAAALTFDEARHLLARTGFGIAKPADIEALLPLTREQAVAHILGGIRQNPIVDLPQFKADPIERIRYGRKDPAACRDLVRRYSEDRQALKRWWAREMLVTDSPLTERLVLFWHNHFVTESRKIGYAQWMYEQNAAFRREAAGNFKTLLFDVATGPAMLVYLDGHKNVKGSPNENFARELLELFTLGEGQGYTEKDIREAARAFTGWTIHTPTAAFDFKPERHDQGLKTFMGETGNFQGADILMIVLRQKQAALHIAKKLWREFVSAEPNPEVIAKLADEFRTSDYELRPLLRGILLSREFWDDQNRGSLVKSPVDLVIGTLRFLEFTDTDPATVVRAQRAMGQDPFDPPNVRGWPGQAAWFNSVAVLQRDIFLRALNRNLLAARNSPAGAAAAVPGRLGMPDIGRLTPILARPAEEIRQLMLAIEPAMPPAGSGSGIELLTELILDPVYNLK